MNDVTTDRLKEIQSELAAILEARLAALTESMRGTEGVTRRIVAAEIEIERHRSARTQLDAELSSLQADLSALTARSAEAQDGRRRLSAEREALAVQVEGVEREVREIDAETAKMRQKVGSLNEEADSLRAENSNLKMKLKTMEENITRMRRLKEELMSSISGLTAQMTGLAGSGAE